MKRNDFLKKSLTGITLAGLATWFKQEDAGATTTKNVEQVGFNHLPPERNTHMANTIIHKAASRGHANHGWLNSHHSFSFASYYNPERMHFGVLRVLNDDTVEAGMGFGTHPHDNMEIISIPLSGDLEHKDSMNNVTVIKEGDVQIMSAGTGIYHSEYNRNKDKQVSFLQIWVFPQERNIKPRYDQKTFSATGRTNRFQTIVSPVGEAGGVEINQQAWFSMANLQKEVAIDYDVHRKGNGVYVFVLKGDVKINGELLGTRDGMGLWDTEKITLSAVSDTEVLLMDIPMNID